MKKYKRIYQSFNDLQAGLSRAQGFYSEMKETVSSLQKNVDTFVNNRRSEGGQLLQNIEHKKNLGADQEQQRLKDLMERMSMEPSGSPVSTGGGRERKRSIPAPLSSTPLNQGGQQAAPSVPHHAYNPASSPPITPRYPVTSQPSQQYPQQTTYPPHSNSYQPQYPSHSHSHSHSQTSYNPTNYGPVSPPAHQQYFSPPPNQQQQQPWGPPNQHKSQQHQHQHQQYSYGGGTPQPNGQQLPQGYVPPPPPPGPPPSQYNQYTGGYTQGQQGQGQPGGAHDPWAGLNQWK